MLPWFVSIQNNHETLEVLESGTWFSLAAAYQDLNHGETSLSGLSNYYGNSSYKFLAVVVLTGLEEILDTLVGRQQWDVPNVMRE